jgi:hypothetical protein
MTPLAGKCLLTAAEMRAAEDIAIANGATVQATKLQKSFVGLVPATRC